MSPTGKPDPQRGWLPQPLLSLGLALAWLMLQQSVALAQVLSAVVLGLAIPLLLRGLLAEGAVARGPGRRLHALGVALRLLLLVLWDIVLSNLTVARIVLNPAARPQPAWVPVALDLQHPGGIMLLACIITTTPGTVSCVVDEQRRLILVHALDCADGPALAAQIKQRYEQPLREIFE